MNNPSITIVDVGHGNCSVLREENHVAIIDCARRNFLLEYLEQENISEISTIIISHADEDHLSGLLSVLGIEKYRVGRILINPDAVKATRIWEDVKYALNTAFNAGNIDVETGIKAGPVTTWEGEKTRLEIVSPSLSLHLTGSGGKIRNRRVTTNTMSIVVRVLYGDVPVVMLAGDMDQLTLADIEENNRNMTAKFLVYPHHGGNAGNTDLAAFTTAILTAVSPEAVLFSNGRGKFDNPQPIIVDAVKAFGTKTIACTQLSVKCSSNTPENGHKNQSKIFSAGGRLGMCCAGSMEIDLAAGAILTPTKTQHLEYVRNLATPICQ
jgi:competence protein ComEC